MAKITREQIQGLTVEDPLKAELLSLFDGIIEREKTISNLQAKVPGDSQQIVEKVDYAAFQNAQKELAEHKQKLAELLATKKPNSDEFIFPFSGLFGFGPEEK